MIRFFDSHNPIFIHDNHIRRFGVQFAENQFCKGVLTLYFDDIVADVDRAVIF